LSITFSVHWLSATIWANVHYGLKMWDVWFEKYLGPMQPVGHGGRGFKATYKALLEAKMYANPISQDGIDNEYYCYEIPGQACDAIPDKDLQEFVITMNRWEKVRFTRLDLAWDGAPFTPEQVAEAVNAKQMRSYLRRRKMTYYTSPHEFRQDGQIGTSTLRLGSNYSHRLLRVYNERGPVRLELQARSARADAIARDVLTLLPKLWMDKAIGHLRDYVDFLDVESGKLLPWWEEFINNQDRAMKTISIAREVTLSKMFGWTYKSVSVILSVIADVLGKEAVDALIVAGRQKRGNRFTALLSDKSQRDSNSVQGDLQ
jgi:DNA relaxase NicK